MKRLIYLLWLVMASCTCRAATRNWTNTWNQTGYDAGDTVNLYGSAWTGLTSGFAVTNSGTPGVPITFAWQSGCSMSITSLPSVTSFITLNGRHDLTFDGGSGPATPNTLSIGLLNNGTTASTPPGTNSYAASNIKGFDGSTGCTNIVFKNLTIRGLYNRMGYTNATVSGTVGILVVGRNITISNCFLGEMPDCVAVTWATGSESNFFVLGCTLTNYNHGIQVATASANSFYYNVIIANNRLYSGDMYETKDGMDVGLHRDPIFFFSEAPFPARSSMLSNTLVYGNYIKQGFQPLSTTAGTAAVFQDFYRTYQAAHMWVFNNISELVYPLQWSGGGGMIAGWGIDSLVANNTCIAWATNGVYGGGSPGWVVAGTNAWGYNNICQGAGGVWIVTQCDTTGKALNCTDFNVMTAGVYSDKNIYNGQGSQSFVGLIFDTNTVTFLEPLYDNLASARADCFTTARDPNSKTNLITLQTGWYLPTSDTIARLSGTNLTSWGITNDFYGQARPSTGNWTIGAVEGFAPAVNPPSSLIVGRQDFNGKSTIK